jgi:4-hydroxy-2-oxoheptanedioate aldolase
MRGARVREKLAAGGAVLNVMVPFHSPAVIEMLGIAGVDMVMLDAEHGAIDEAMCEHMVRAADVVDLPAIVRVPNNQPSTILRYLDTGVHGAHIPWVNSAAEAERAVQSVKYAPRGIRGLAGSRASEWGIREPLSAFVERSNRETLVVIHIETQEAVDAIDDYLAIDGVDVLFIGPTDLSQSLSHPGDTRHPDVLAALDRVAAAVVGSEKVLGIYAGTVDMTKEWLDKGARYFTTSLEPFLRQGMTAHLRDVRG